MTDITAEMVRTLRDKTNCPMDACKHMLVKAEGDMREAERLLRNNFWLPTVYSPAPTECTNWPCCPCESRKDCANRMTPGNMQEPDPTLWTIHHNGQSATGKTIMEVAKAAQALRTEEEQDIAAENLQQALDRESAEKDSPAPIDMVLHCPKCGTQHIDEPDERAAAWRNNEHTGPWTNPPHRSHLCADCGHIWRPADVPTNGVQAVKTKGQNDSPVVSAPMVEFIKAISEIRR